MGRFFAEQAFSHRPFEVAPATTQLLLVRHGATIRGPGEQAEPVAFDGSDPDLNELGRRQAEAVCRQLTRERPAAIFVTGLRRTEQTAAPLATRTGIAPRVVRDLREVELGAWDGAGLRTRLASEDPLALQVLRDERWDAIPGAEPLDGFADRVRRGIALVSESIDFEQTAVAFVHGGVIGEVCRQATASRGFAFIHAENGSITRLIVDADDHWTVRSFNETGHLA